MTKLVFREWCVEWLANRWTEECERFPTMRNDIPLELYLQRNLKPMLESRHFQDRWVLA
jgi:hypothetical protein